MEHHCFQNEGHTLSATSCPTPKQLYSHDEENADSVESCVERFTRAIVPVLLVLLPIISSLGALELEEAMGFGCFGRGYITSKKRQLWKVGPMHGAEYDAVVPILNHVMEGKIVAAVVPTILHINIVQRCFTQ